ncbi:MAG: cell envelope integrity EipB family protein [Ahrensia sp.]|nr:cell envelope integrity EipB family protein [Ahrensia sp.]
MRHVFKSSLLVSSILIFTGAAQAAVMLAPHRAVYEVKLKEASDRSGITGMNGRIVYEFRGSACEGYTTDFRFVTRLFARGESNVTDQRTSTFEDGAGEMFRFVTKTYVGEAEDKNIEGIATPDEDGTFVELKKPDAVNLELGKALFPTQHIIDMIERAQNNERFYEEKIFDGSDGGDRVLATTVVIGPQKNEPSSDDKIIGALKDDPYRSVSVSYFDEDENTDGLPEYTIAFKMHDNGISRALDMDYGDFSLQGEITSLELFEQEPCK